MRTVHVIVPEGVDDPARPSGGNTFDRRVCSGLAAAGWTLHVHSAPGAWPRPGPDSYAALGDLVQGIPDGAVVLVDGLVGSAAADVLVPVAGRLRLVVLVHMLLGQVRDDGDREREAAVLSAAASVVTTSAWTRQLVMDLYSLPGARVHVAEPGVDPAALAPGTPSAGALLSVAAVIPGKGHDLLIDALAMLGRRRWRCLCVGSVERDRAFARDLRRRAERGGLHERVRFPGVQTEAELARAYGASDVLVVPSRAETYGLVVTEALARGLPVIAADVGGVPEALGYGSDGTRPGLLVRPDDAGALGDAIRVWLEDASLRRQLRRAARERRASLPRWSTTTARVADALAGAAA
jgi:glycosyltransferase involved in cell wall biosynthesis